LIFLKDIFNKNTYHITNISITVFTDRLEYYVGAEKNTEGGIAGFEYWERDSRKELVVSEY